MEEEGDCSRLSFSFTVSLLADAKVPLHAKVPLLPIHMLGRFDPLLYNVSH